MEEPEMAALGSLLTSAERESRCQTPSKSEPQTQSPRTSRMKSSDSSALRVGLTLMLLAGCPGVHSNGATIEVSSMFSSGTMISSGTFCPLTTRSENAGSSRFGCGLMRDSSSTGVLLQMDSQPRLQVEVVTLSGFGVPRTSRRTFSGRRWGLRMRHGGGVQEDADGESTFSGPAAQRLRRRLGNQHSETRSNHVKTTIAIESPILFAPRTGQAEEMAESSQQ